MHQKILTIVGARPQFIKAAPVSRAVQQTSELQEILLHTGQHYDAQMSQRFFDDLQLPKPRYNLGIAGGARAGMIARMQRGITEVLHKERPDMVMLYGDTNSTLAGALAAAQARIPIAHIEAGLRSFNPAMAEETNRIRTDHLSTLLLCPTRAAMQNLACEGIRDGVHHVGDVMYDAALSATDRPRDLAALGLTPGRYALATLHRAENTDDPAQLANVLGYLKAIACQIPVILPIHPRLRGALARDGLPLGTVRGIDPQGYFEMQTLLRHAACALTDSGGLQKEAYFHRTPCITLRGETEWTETVEAGWNRLWTEPRYQPRRTIMEYGTGRAAKACVQKIEAFLTQAKPACSSRPLAMVGA